MSTPTQELLAALKRGAPFLLMLATVALLK